MYHRIIFEKLSNNDYEIRVHVDQCGLFFKNIIFIEDFNNINPLFSVPNPIGIHLLQDILNAWYKEGQLIINSNFSRITVWADGLTETNGINNENTTTS